MPKVSIIMPSLNVAKYISSCMESVLMQTLKDIEILVVDAGSIDGTLEIVQKYAALDRRIKVINSEKKSYGFQVNKGISLAQGQYIGIVETDDMIMPDMYRVLLDTAVEYNAEYVKGRAACFIEWDGILWNKPIETPLKDKALIGKIIEPQNMPELLVRDIYLWTGIYKKEFISKIVLNETPGAAFQDQGFLFQTISSARRAVYLDNVFYQYRQDNRNSSIFNTKSFRFLVQEYSYIENFLKGLDEKWKVVYYQRMFNQCLGRFRIMAVSGTFWEKASSDIQILQKHLIDAVENGYLKFFDMDKDTWQLLKSFLNGDRHIYSYYANLYQEKKREIDKILKAIRGKKVIIFGCGQWGRFFHALLESNRLALVMAYCDNESSFQGTKVQGIEVLSPENIVMKYSDACYVIASREYADKMQNQLIDLGINPIQIFVYHTGIDMLLFRMNFK